MKKLIATALFLSLMSGVARAEYIAHETDNIAAHLSGYQLIPAGLTTNQPIHDAGIQSNTAYICIPVTNIAYLTVAAAAESGGSSSWRSLVLGVAKTFYNEYASFQTTNRPAALSITEQVRAGTAGGDLRFTHSIDSEFSISTGGVSEE